MRETKRSPTTALDKVRSVLKKTEHVSTPLSAKRKLKSKRKEKKR